MAVMEGDKDKTILLVDDEVDIRDAMMEALKGAGFRVATAGNGQEGYESAMQLKPDLIILDLRMPVMDGLEMLQKLRSNWEGRKFKVIIMSAMDDVHNIASAHEINVSDYLIKTHTSLKDMLNQVRQVIYSDD